MNIIQYLDYLLQSVHFGLNNLQFRFETHIPAHEAEVIIASYLEDGGYADIECYVGSDDYSIIVNVSFTC